MRTAGPSWVRALALALVAALLARADASAVNTAVATTDENACRTTAPDVPTLRRNSDDDDYAVVVYPNCTVVSIPPTAVSGSAGDSTTIDASSLGIKAVTSCPNVDLLCVRRSHTLRTRELVAYCCGCVFYRNLADNAVAALSDSEGDCQVTTLYVRT
jgi:hypothetical protein